MTTQPPAPNPLPSGVQEDAGGDVRLPGQTDHNEVRDEGPVDGSETDKKVGGGETDKKEGGGDLAGLPQNPLLIAAHQLFAHGDNRAALETLARISDQEPEDVRAARDALRARMRPDRVTLLVAAACVLLAIVIAYLAIST